MYKNIFLFGLMLTCLFSFGKCNKKKCCKKKETATSQKMAGNLDEVWMQYNETKCENPWHFDWLVAPTDKQIAGAVKGELAGKDIKILDIQTSRDKEDMSCDGCTCPNGFHYYVRVNKNEIDKLKALKFYEVKEVPEMKTNDNTK